MTVYFMCVCVCVEKKDELNQLTTPSCSDALAFQSLRLVSSLPEIT